MQIFTTHLSPFRFLDDQDLPINNPSPQVLQQLEEYSQELQGILEHLEQVTQHAPSEHLSTVESALQEARRFLQGTYRHIQRRYTLHYTCLIINHLSKY